ncbi:hypothetical protein BDN72DRAFT_614355 [Pluteus cervinus]|uniref:Uncharacterized protein n=1 Tax=Pluteus cervinus TaxID=181527 RepID=A0ACD3AUP8_9AGAR|nr:hypothetical protein BDN72DRAFT_614355 [Pluteus cervinus]
MSTDYVLHQFGDDPFNNFYKDPEGRAAFTISPQAPNPNPVIRLTREAAWAQQHPSIMGPDNSYFYFGPENKPGYLVYGNNKNSILMCYFWRQKREGSTSRYFITQSGREYKWRITDSQMECVDGHGRPLARWELSDPEADYHAQITIKPAGLTIITEILTTLVLNRMAQVLQWEPM